MFLHCNTSIVGGGYLQGQKLAPHLSSLSLLKITGITPSLCVQGRYTSTDELRPQRSFKLLFYPTYLECIYLQMAAYRYFSSAFRRMNTRVNFWGPGKLWSSTSTSGSQYCHHFPTTQEHSHFKCTRWTAVKSSIYSCIQKNLQYKSVYLKKSLVLSVQLYNDTPRGSISFWT